MAESAERKQGQQERPPVRASTQRREMFSIDDYPAEFVARIARNPGVLTGLQMDVWERRQTGHTNAQIAVSLQISVKGVEGLVCRLKQNLARACAGVSASDERWKITCASGSEVLEHTDVTAREACRKG